MSSSLPPLHGLTVVEHTQSVAGGYAGRLLAVLGADVILTEPPQGHRLRQAAPLIAPDVSSVFAYLAAGKRSLTVDLSSVEGREKLDSLLDTADVLLDDSSAVERDLWQISPEQVRSGRESLNYVSVRPFGMTGPKSDWFGEEVNLFHASGEGYLLPNGYAQEEFPGRAPLKMFGYFAQMQGGVMAVVSTLASLISGKGQLIDVSVQDALVALTAFGIQRYGDGSIEHRSTRSFKYGGVLKCADGYVELLTLEDRQWRGLVELIGAPEWAVDPELSDGVVRGQRGAEINAKLREWARGVPTQELVARAQELGVPAAKYAKPEEVLQDPHEVARGIFQSVDVGGLGQLPILSAPFHIDGQPLKLRGGPPPRQHNTNGGVAAVTSAIPNAQKMG